MENIDLYTTAAKCIKNKFKFLFDMGYTIENTNYNYDFVGHNALQIIFSNDIIYRKVKITLIDYTDTYIDYFFRFKIENTNSKDNCMFSFFNLIQYLVSKKIPYDIKLFYLENYNGTYEERIPQLLDYVCNILQKYLMLILSGKEWEDIDFMYGIR